MLCSFVHESNWLWNKTTDTLNGLSHEQCDVASCAKVNGVLDVLSVKLSRIAHASVWSSEHIWERSSFDSLGSWNVVVPATNACQMLATCHAMITILKSYDWVVTSMSSRKLSGQSVRF